MTFLLGIDLGTSAVKALLLPADPSLPIETESVALPLSTPHPGWSEQDPAEWWAATVTAIGQLLQRTAVDAGRIVGVGLSGQMHGATLLDADGRVLRPCILWNDQRSGGECEWITERVGARNLLEWVGNPPLAGFTVPKLLWVRNNEPDIFARATRVLLPKDYVNYLLTDRQATDYSDASGTLLFDVAQREWSGRLADALDLPLDLFPAAMDSAAVLGEVTPEAAAATGLQPGTPVVAGGADNACAAVGMGVLRSGQVLASIGTSGTLLAPMDAPRIDPAGRLHTFCHAVPHMWYAMGVVLSAGGSLRWWRDILFPEHPVTETYDDMLAEGAEAPPGSDGLIFLPYLTGERTPHGDPDARGVFFGLSLRHRRAHMTRSVIEGVSFALADSAALMRNLGVRLDAVRVTGGGARSELWRAILASLLEARVLTAFADAGPAFGAAVLAGAGTGVWASVAEATDALVRMTGETAPDPVLSGVYARYHRVYDSLYPALAGSFHDLTGLAEMKG